MIRFIFLVALLCCLSEARKLTVFKGKRVDITRFPFVVGLVAPNRYCTGSLVSKEWISTAGHCIDDKNNFVIYFLTNYIDDKKQGFQLPMLYAKTNPGYSVELDGFDMAFVKVKGDPIVKGAQIAKIDVDHPVPVGTLAMAMGYGADTTAPKDRIFKVATIKTMACPKEIEGDAICFTQENALLQ